MTLIKSTDGTGWVEARVLDRCFYLNGEDGSRVPFRIEEIQDGMLLFNNGCEGVDPSECQLIERPMQVDDPIEVMEAGVWVNNRDVYSGSEYAKKCYGAGLTRHSSPLLRPVVSDNQIINKPAPGGVNL